MKSHSNYVEVAYFRGVQMTARKEVFYQPNEANDVFQKTVAKFTGSESRVIISLRDHEHNFIKGFRNF